MADPLDPAAWNRFSYVYNSPTNYIDPSGHFPWLFAAFAFAGGFIGGAAYISQHPFDSRYILKHPTAPESIEFYKSVVGGELLAVSLWLPFSSSASFGIRGAVVASHILTWGSDVRSNFIAGDREGLGLILPRSSWQTYLGNAWGAVLTAGLLEWTTWGPVLSAGLGAAFRRSTINWFETGSVDVGEVAIDTTVSALQAWLFGLVWPPPRTGLDFTKPPLGQKEFGARDMVSAEFGVLFGFVRNKLLEWYCTPYVPLTPTPTP